MGRTIGALCALIVGLQILIGVPVLVCLAFFCLADGGGGPVAVEVHAGHNSASPLVVAGQLAPPSSSPAMGLPPNIIPAALDNPILASRAQHGSPFAGTVLSETVGPDAEQQLFVAALEKVAAENVQCPHSSSDSPHAGPSGDQPAMKPEVANADPDANVDRDNLRTKAAQFAVLHLYAMANMDERAGEYERADQWRSL